MTVSNQKMLFALSVSSSNSLKPVFTRAYLVFDTVSTWVYYLPTYEFQRNVLFLVSAFPKKVDFCVGSKLRETGLQLRHQLSSQAGFFVL